MKKKDLVDLHHKEKEELMKLIAELQREIDKIRLDMKLGKSKNTSLVREKRKSLVQMLTVLSEKEEKI